MFANGTSESSPGYELNGLFAGLVVLKRVIIQVTSWGEVAGVKSRQSLADAVSAE